MALVNRHNGVYYPFLKSSASLLIIFMHYLSCCMFLSFILQVGVLPLSCLHRKQESVFFIPPPLNFVKQSAMISFNLNLWYILQTYTFNFLIQAKNWENGVMLSTLFRVHSFGPAFLVLEIDGFVCAYLHGCGIEVLVDKCKRWNIFSDKIHEA